jgi:tetratricopeptide (TPR) repeat protein
VEHVLDAEEYLFLTTHYTDKEEYAQALKVAKEGSCAYPEDSKLNYILGALHAQIGMYDQAKVEIQEAIERSPDLITAHFQLGLLHLTSGDFAEAEKSWQALDHLSENHPLQLFKSGMLALVRDQFEQCIEKLEQGINSNLELPTLNKDMQNVIESVKAQQNWTPDSNATKKASSAKFLLSNYDKSTKN